MPKGSDKSIHDQCIPCLIVPHRLLYLPEVEVAIHPIEYRTSEEERQQHFRRILQLVTHVVYFVSCFEITKLRLFFEINEC